MRLNIAPAGRTAGERFLRSIGLLLVFALVAYAFWLNTQRTMEQLQTKNAIWDQTGVMNKQDIRYFKSFSRSMNDRFGIKVVIHVSKDKITLPKTDSTEMFIGVCPSKKQVVMNFPGLIRHALGPEFIDYLHTKHFADSFTENSWVSALQTAVAMIWQKLVDVENESELNAMDNDAASQQTAPALPKLRRKQE